MKNLIKRLGRRLGNVPLPANVGFTASHPLSDLPLPYSWILTNRLAVGPMPRTEAHWQQLDDAGLRSRFSCCYEHELEFASIPPHWRTFRFSLPDHRRQEPLDIHRLSAALNAAESIFLESPPLYVHCMAGIERSPLIAIGLTARARQLSLFDALDWVRRCHPASLPIYSHLELLEKIIH